MGAETTGSTAGMGGALPYRLACLCDLRDERGRILLLRRAKEPNKGLCSPIGGKLDMHTGESPAQCARREIMEEAGIDVPIERLHLGGLISERAYEGKGHWLLFYYRVLGPVKVERTEIREGTLEWFHPHEVDGLPLPDTDRQIIWPMIRKHDGLGAAHGIGGGGKRPGFFTLHIDCEQPRRAGEKPTMTWVVEQEQG